MGTITRKELDDLAGQVHDGAVSVYLPTHRQKEEIGQDPIQLKNLLAEAERQLLASGRSPREVHALLGSAQALVTDPDFWSGRQRGLALFLTEGAQPRWFHLPIEVEPAVTVARHFQIAPLVPLLHNPGFYVLAVSQNKVRMLEGDRFGEHTVEVKGLPQNLINALNYHQPERVFQAHLFVQKSGARLVSVHGDGGAADKAKEEVQEYFRMIDEALASFLRGKHQPVVFAGVDYLFPIYREVNTYTHLAQTHIAGNADLLSPQQLHAEALAALAPLFDEPVARALSLAAPPAAHSASASELAAILRAAHEGRVETLVVPRGAQAWGTFDEGTAEAHVAGSPAPGREDLVSRTIAEVLTHGGMVYQVEAAAGGSRLAAVYRYPAEAAAAR